MSYATTPEKSTAVRPTYVPLGTDSEGRHHVYRTDDETVHVVDPDGGRTRRESLGTRPVDDWMDFVAYRRGWARRQYGRDRIADISEGLE